MSNPDGNAPHFKKTSYVRRLRDELRFGKGSENSPRSKNLSDRPSEAARGFEPSTQDSSSGTREIQAPVSYVAQSQSADEERVQPGPEKVNPRQKSQLLSAPLIVAISNGLFIEDAGGTGSPVVPDRQHDFVSVFDPGTGIWILIPHERFGDGGDVFHNLDKEPYRPFHILAKETARPFPGSGDLIQFTPSRCGGGRPNISVLQPSQYQAGQSGRHCGHSPATIEIQPAAISAAPISVRTPRSKRHESRI
jgi:hypothetical protein